jgi:glycosyltransferase involved in cell wall biosynthesis
VTRLRSRSNAAIFYYVKHFVIFSLTESNTDPRVRKQLIALNGLVNVTVYGYGGPLPSGENFVPLDRGANEKYPLARKMFDGFLLLTGQFEKYFWRRPQVQSVSRIKFPQNVDAYIVHDFEALAVLLQIAPNTAEVFLDAREFTPDEIPSGVWYRALLQRYRKVWLVGQHIKRVKGIMTVSPVIAEAYKKWFGVDIPTVVLNVPDFQELHPSKVQANSIRLVHHGLASRPRRLELLIRLLELLDPRFELHFVLVPTDEDSDYIDEFKAAAMASKRATSIHFHDPVPFTQIARFIQKFDIGVFFHLPDTINAENALPNKFFEFIQARLAVAIGPSPEMRNIVESLNLGVVSSEFKIQELANLLNNLTSQQVADFKVNSDAAADTYNTSREVLKMVSLFGLSDSESNYPDQRELL